MKTDSSPVKRANSLWGENDAKNICTVLVTIVLLKLQPVENILFLYTLYKTDTISNREYS